MRVGCDHPLSAPAIICIAEVHSGTLVSPYEGNNSIDIEIYPMSYKKVEILNFYLNGGVSGEKLKLSDDINPISKWKLRNCFG